MKHYTDLVAEALREGVEEIFPWDLVERLREGSDLLLLDIREPDEFARGHIEGSLHLPRGLLESACEWDYEETVPVLAAGRDREIVVICRSGNRSVLAAKTMREMGFRRPISLKTGIRGWNDYEQPLVDGTGNPVDPDEADGWLTSRVRPEQRKP